MLNGNQILLNLYLSMCQIMTLGCISVFLMAHPMQCLSTKAQLLVVTSRVGIEHDSLSSRLPIERYPFIK